MALVAVSLMGGTANAVTKKPTPTPTKKVTATPTVKASVKATSKATATSKTTVKPTAKATASATATKKKVVYKPKPRKKVKLTSRKPAPWPPKGYFQSGDVYAKVPTNAEALDNVGDDKTGKTGALYASCQDLACGTVFAGSVAGCNWWVISGDLVGPSSDTESKIVKIGTVTSYFGASEAKKIKTYVLQTTEPLKNGYAVVAINLTCHRNILPSDIKIPSSVYIKETTD
ncbi:MAG: hypothetical protein ACKOCL_02395 [Candidatus Nanopelagicaceae bacterium]